MDILPLGFGFPFGLTSTVPANFPLPSKIVHEVLDPIHVTELFGENPDVDVIILDINMPHMTGLEFLGQVKGKPEFAAIPVIIVSTEGKEEDVARGLQAGAVAYLKKPFQREDLLKIIGRFTGKQASA